MALSCRPIWLVGLLIAAGCQSNEHPPAFIEDRSSDGGHDAGTTIDVDPGDGSSFCGEQIIPSMGDPPTIYFVIDRSGSMADPYEDTGNTKYETARDALGDLLAAVGHRIRYGAAVFPAFTDGEGCAAGVQILPPTQGDPSTYAAMGERGPILRDLLRRLGYVDESGGTPTAATIAGLKETLAAQGPKTSVVLVTDGAPNCNGTLSCDAEQCMLNIEGVSVLGKVCSPSYNCCDPELTGTGANEYCLDDEALVQEVEALKDKDIATYVIGMPGTEAYRSILQAVAVAGGTARKGDTAYYEADDTAALGSALRQIATNIAISCQIELDDPPDDGKLVNLYFDGQLVPADPENGWAWTNDSTIEVRGSACKTLKSGDVLEALVGYGCPTVVR